MQKGLRYKDKTGRLFLITRVWHKSVPVVNIPGQLQLWDVQDKKATEQMNLLQDLLTKRAFPENSILKADFLFYPHTIELTEINTGVQKEYPVTVFMNFELKGQIVRVYEPFKI